MSATLSGMNFLQSTGIGRGRRVNGMTKEELEERVLGIQVAQNKIMQKMATMGMPTMQAWQQQQQQQKQQQQSQSQNPPQQNQNHGRTATKATVDSRGLPPPPFLALLSRPKKITGDINWFYRYNIL
jgi:hypothetical protein